MKFPKKPEELTFAARAEEMLKPLQDAKLDLDQAVQELHGLNIASPLEGIDLSGIGPFPLATRSTDSLEQRAELVEKAQQCLEGMGLTATFKASEEAPIQSPGLPVSEAEFNDIRRRLQIEHRERCAQRAEGYDVNIVDYYLRDDALRTLEDGTPLMEALAKWFDRVDLHASLVSNDALEKQIAELPAWSMEWVMARIRQTQNRLTRREAFHDASRFKELAFPDRENPEKHGLSVQRMVNWARGSGSEDAWIFSVTPDKVQFACRGLTDKGKRVLRGVEWTESGGRDYLRPTGMQTMRISIQGLFDPDVLYAVSEAK